MTKYHAKRTNGYASKREANRASELQALAKVGKITTLKEQVRFIILPKTDLFPRPLVYVADFTYTVPPNDYCEVPIDHVEDVKGFRTPVYMLKKRLMQQLLGIEIEEI